MSEVNKVLSKYVSIFPFEGKHIVLSHRTGQLVVLEDELFRGLGNAQVIPEKFNNTLEILEKHRIVVPAGDETQEVLDELNKKVSDSKGLVFTIMPTSNCQFKCVYCSQVRGQVMTPKTQHLALERIKHKLQESPAQGDFSLQINWFGGEPLLALDILRTMSAKIKEDLESYYSKYSATITSNGLLLNKETVKMLIEECSVNHIEVTLDGFREAHDSRRFIGNGKPSYDIIIKNLKEVCSEFHAECKFVVRVNVDKGNKEEIIKLLEDLKSQELHDKIVLYIAPVHDWGNDASKDALSKKEIAELDLAVLIKMHELGFDVNFIPQRKSINCIATSRRGEVYDPSGGVFDCSEYPLIEEYNLNGKNQYQIGELSVLSVQAPLLRNQHLHNFLSNIKGYECYDCSVFPLCLGSCPKQKSEGKNACPTFKSNMVDRLALHYYFNVYTKKKECPQRSFS